MDCTSEFTSKFYELKLQELNAKVTVVNVIVPVCNEEMHTELSKPNFMSITINTSVKKSTCDSALFLTTSQCKN
jgi:hypothetical protein